MLLGAYDAYVPVANRVSRKVRELSLGEEVPTEDLEEMSTTAAAIQKERQRVKLVGPDAIHDKAVELEESVWTHQHALMQLAEALHNAYPLAGDLAEEEREARRDNARTHDSFVRAVGALLEDRGT